MKYLRLITLVIFIFLTLSVDADIHKDRSKDVLVVKPFKFRSNTNHNIRERKAEVNDNKHCVCDSRPNFKLTIIYNAAFGLVAGVNESSNVGVVGDFVNDLALLLNGETGVAILLNYHSNTAYQLNDVWKASKEPFSQYFQALTSLKPLLETAKLQGGGTPITNPSKAIKAEIAHDINNLDGGSGRPEELIDEIGKAVTSLKGAINVVYKGAGTFEVAKDLNEFLKLQSALTELLQNADDLEPIGSLDLGIIFSSNTGLGTIITVMEHIGEKADISKIFGKLFHNHPKFLRLVEKFEKAVSHDGVDGFDTVLTEVILFLYGNGSILDTIASLLNYSPTLEVDPSVLKGYRNRVLKLLEDQMKKYGSKGTIGWLHNIVSRKASKNLVIRNVNITDVMTVLYFRNFRDVAVAIVNILSGLLSPENIPHLVQSILDEPVVQTIIKRLIPGSNGRLSLDGILSVISRLPIVNWLVPKLFELLGNIIGTLNESATDGFKAILHEISSGTLGAATMKLLGGLLRHVINFVMDVLGHLGINIEGPLNALSGIISGIGGAVTNLGPLLLGELDGGVSVNASLPGILPSVGLNIRF